MSHILSLATISSEYKLEKHHDHPCIRIPDFSKDHNHTWFRSKEAKHIISLESAQKSKDRKDANRDVACLWEGMRRSLWGVNGAMSG